MADLDIFSGFESGSTGFSPEKYQEFLAKMREAAAQIKELKKGEQRQKSKENKLAQILAQFIKTNSSSPFSVLIIALLSKNLPPIFIFSLITIAFPELREFNQQNEASHNNLNALSSQNNAISVKANKFPPETISIFKKLPKEVLLWIEEISQATKVQAEKFQQTAYSGPNLLPEIIDLTSLSLKKYLHNQQIYIPDIEIKRFCHNLLHFLFKKNTNLPFNKN